MGGKLDNMNFKFQGSMLIWLSLTQITKIWHNNTVSRRFGKYSFLKCFGKFMKGRKFLTYQNLISSTIEKIIQHRIILCTFRWYYLKMLFIHTMLFLKGHYKLNRIWVSFVSTIAIICHNRFCKTIAWSIVT